MVASKRHIGHVALAVFIAVCLGSGATLPGAVVSADAGCDTAGDCPENPIEIVDTDHFWTLFQMGNAKLDKHYRLAGHVHLDEWLGPDSFWAPIGSVEGEPFTGSLDGNGFVIRGLMIDFPSHPGTAGLFSAIGSGGVLRNVILTDVQILGDGVTGALAGTSAGTIENSIAFGRVETETSDPIGGLVGKLESTGIIRNSYFAGSVTQLQQAPGAAAGGLVGRMSDLARIQDSFAVGYVAGGAQAGGLVGDMVSGSIENAFAAVKVDAPQSFGLVGSADPSADITDSYFVSGSFAKHYVDGDSAVAKSASAMQRQETFASWNFAAHAWQIHEEGTYPYLASLPAPPLLADLYMCKVRLMGDKGPTPFHPALTTYTLLVDSDLTSLDLTPVPVDAGNVMQIVTTKLPGMTETTTVDSDDLGKPVTIELADVTKIAIVVSNPALFDPTYDPDDDPPVWSRTYTFALADGSVPGGEPAVCLAADAPDDPTPLPPSPPPGSGKDRAPAPSRPVAKAWSATTMVTPLDGGTIALPSGTTLTFPPGSVSTPVNVTMTPVAASDGPADTGYFRLGQSFYRIEAYAVTGPPVTEFELPFQLTVPLPAPLPAELSPDDIGIYYWDQRFQQWIRLPGYIDNESGQIVATSDHLTLFGALGERERRRFTDVAGHPAEPTILALLSLDIVHGRDSGDFAPDDPVTRAELAKMVVRALRLPAADDRTGLADASAIPDWAADYVAAAVAADLFTLLPGGEFGPLQSVSQGELNDVLARAWAAATSAAYVHDAPEAGTAVVSRAAAALALYELLDRYYR